MTRDSSSRHFHRVQVLFEYTQPLPPYVGSTIFAKDQRQKLSRPSSKSQSANASHPLMSSSTHSAAAPLPPPTKPRTTRKRKRERELQRERSRTDFEHQTSFQSIPSPTMSIRATAPSLTSIGPKTSVHFAFDEEAVEYMSMYVVVNMNEFKLTLCEARHSPFCQFTIDGFHTEWNRHRNGHHGTYLTVNAIELKKMGGHGIEQQQYTQMLCPFDQIQMFVQNPPPKRTSTTTSSVSHEEMKEMKERTPSARNNEKSPGTTC